MSAALLCAGVLIGLLVNGDINHVNVMAQILAGLTLLLVLIRVWQVYCASSAIAEQMTEQSMIDPLTGLGNRRQVMADLNSALKLAQPRAFVLFDLNGFKHYNDTFGHPSGDELLRRLADRLADAMPDDAFAYRLGGDEFCALLPARRDIDTVVNGRVRLALSEVGSGYEVTTAYGVIIIPQEAGTIADAQGSRTGACTRRRRAGACRSANRCAT
ncbi:MAG: GGDEF domain-containing protein [Solirubrobacteraceae bacterium]